MLSEQGYLTIGARGGKEALLILKERKIDLILSDSIMPEMNGVQLLQQIKKKYPEIPFVFITGFSADQEELQGVSIVDKPISLQALIDVCEQHLVSSPTSVCI